MRGKVDHLQILNKVSTYFYFNLDGTHFCDANDGREVKMDEEFDRSQYSSASISPDATFLERVSYGAGK